MSAQVRGSAVLVVATALAVVGVFLAPETAHAAPKPVSVKQCKDNGGEVIKHSVRTEPKPGQMGSSGQRTYFTCRGGSYDGRRVNTLTGS